ncbi:MAG: ABC transporter substrate-binding protein [Catonella sp.]|uniref:ABC transporter substrate-binding protein n=1 Tax=Catonella sp. TaxID=2382125 RepID=UPI003FA0100C
MKKNYLKSLLALGLSASMLVACGSTGGATGSKATTDSAAKSAASTASTAASTATSSAPASNGEAVRLVNGKIEIDKQLQAAAKLFKEKTGQEVIVESMGGGVDIQGQIKSYFAADNMPDMFVVNGDGDYKNWEGKCVDLSDCKFAQDTDFGYKDKNDGTLVGFPYAVEGYGITYNADILEKAGIDPASLISYDAFKAAFEKLDSMKAELGLDAVASVAAESGQMFWSTGNHIFGYYYSGGLQRGDNSLLDKALAGEFDKARLTEFADMVELLFKYADQQVLLSGTYDDQLAKWAQGKTAFITQGNWVDPSLSKYNVSFKCGIAPLAFTKADMPNVLADCPSWWCVYKDSKNIQACKDFFDFLATTDEGQSILVKEAGMISPYKSSTILPKAPLATSLKTYVDAGKTSSWAWSNMPEGIAQNAFGLVFESFAKGDLDKAAFVEAMQTALSDYIANNK